MSRRVYLLGVGLALVALLLAVTDGALGPSPGVTEANFRRIRPGMTFDEVDAILGPLIPEERAAFEASKTQPKWRERAMRVLTWNGPAGDIVVHFNENWLVDFATPYLDDSPAKRPGPLSRLRAWLGW